MSPKFSRHEHIFWILFLYTKFWMIKYNAFIFFPVFYTHLCFFSQPITLKFNFFLKMNTRLEQKNQTINSSRCNWLHGKFKFTTYQETLLNWPLKLGIFQFSLENEMRSDMETCNYLNEINWQTIYMEVWVLCAILQLYGYRIGPLLAR